MNRSIVGVSLALGLLAVGWMAWGFVGTSPMALVMTLFMAGVYAVGAVELWRFRGATASLRQALVQLPPAPQPWVGELTEWLQRLHPGLRSAVAQRIEGERVALPGPGLTPYLVGFLVMLGMLGTFLGMVVTFKGAVFALEGSSNLEAIRGALAAPIKGLSLSFGTSVAGVAASAALGLALALCRRERVQVVRLLDAAVSTTFKAFSAAQQREDLLKTLQVQSQALPQIADRLNALMEGVERRHQQWSEQQQAQQLAFHAHTEQTYTQLAQTVGRSLNDSLTASARAASDTLRPVVQEAVQGLTRVAEEAQSQLTQAAHTHWQGMAQTLSAQWQGTAQQVAQTWTQALAQHSQAQQQVLDGLDQRLVSWSQGLESRSQAWVGALEQASQQQQQAWAQAVAQQTTAQQQLHTELEQRLSGWSQTLEDRSQRWLTELERTTQAQHTAAALADAQRLAQWQQQWAQGMAQITQQWQQAAQQAVAEQQSWREALHTAAQHTTAQVGEQVQEAMGRAVQLLGQTEALVAERTQTEAQWQQGHQQRMDAMAQVWQRELNALRDQEAAHAQAAVQRMEALQAAVAQHLAQLGAELEAPLTRLLTTASEVPQAAAQVMTQLRQEVSRLAERDAGIETARLASAQQLEAVLHTLDASAQQQRQAVDALVAQAGAVLTQAGEQFAHALAQQSAQATEAGHQALASAVELATLSQAFEQGVASFATSNEQLLQGLKRIEAALGQSLKRSDDQLAYYVAQARELMDLSISAQQGIVEDLRRLKQPAPALKVQPMAIETTEEGA